MIPFRLHRRIPLIRRPFFQRDQAIIERDQARKMVADLQREKIRSDPSGPISEEAASLIQAKAEGRLIVTEYAYRPRSRDLRLSPGGQLVVKRFENERAVHADLFHDMKRHIDTFVRLPIHETGPGPFLNNNWFSPLDGLTLYTMLGKHNPARYIEVGSGISTRFARQAITDLGLRTRIISIDPHPRHDVDVICDETIRSPMEDVPAKFWVRIGTNDMLFVDNSHRSFPNSDVTVFFTEILPALGVGALWGLHDIALPYDYPEYWGELFYSEQYLLMAYLLGGGGRDKLVLAGTWASEQVDLQDAIHTLWAREDLLLTAGNRSSSFWMQRL